MEKIITIDGKQVPFKATAGTIRKYRRRFGRDLLVDFARLEKEAKQAEGMTVEALTIFEDLAYTMAKDADETIPETADEWLDGFEMFSIYVVLPQIVELWSLSTLPTAEQKKKLK